MFEKERFIEDCRAALNETDPHAAIHALDMTGGLHRGNFGVEDEREHYWFRARLVQRLAEDSAHIVLFPRPELQHDMRELLGLDVAGQPSRFTVVPEGVDLRVSAAAAETGVKVESAKILRLRDVLAEPV